MLVPEVYHRPAGEHNVREGRTRFEPPALMEYRVVKSALPLTDHLGAAGGRNGPGAVVPLD